MNMTEILLFVGSGLGRAISLALAKEDVSIIAIDIHEKRYESFGVY
jgi:hypothetical protein